MALTLAQANAVSRDQIAAGVGQVFTMNSFVLDRLGFESIQGTAYKYFTESALPGAEFRAVNSSYSESTGTFTSATEGLTILGGDADVDRFLQLTRSDLIDQRAGQVAMKARAVAHKFNDTFINGNTGTDANSFNGLKARLTGGQVLSSGTNGAAINTDSATRNTFLDNLDALIGSVPGCDVLLTNRQILAKYRSAARQLTAAQTTVDSLGRTVDVYNGISIVDIGNKADGSQIIPQTETQGSSSVAGSIYAVNFAGGAPEQGVVGLTNGGVQVFDLGQLETKPVYRTRIEWFVGLALFGAQPAARLTGVLAA